MGTFSAATLQDAEPGFWKVAAADPERIAVINPDASSITYGELERLVNGLANGLVAAGIGRGSVIAIAAHNHHTHLAIALAAGQIGAYWAPINWHFVAAEMAHILRDSGACAAVVGPGVYAEMNQAMDQADIATDRRFSITDQAGYRRIEDMATGQPVLRPRDLVCGMPMSYTSGTTGVPKGVKRPIVDGAPPEMLAAVGGVIFPHRGLRTGSDVYFVPAPLYHAAPGGHAGEALYHGNTLVLMDRWDSEQALALVDRYRVNTMFVAPIHLTRWLALDASVRARHDTSSVRLVIHAGAPCPVPVKRQAIEWFGPVLYEYYGGAEGIFTSVTSDRWLDHPGTVGNVGDSIAEIRVLDEETRMELPPGQVGLLYSRFPGLAFAYHDDPEKTMQATTKDGFVTLGDMGYIDEDGWLFVVDRRTDMILTGGVNVYPAEVEACLLEHPSVTDAAVVSVPDEKWGKRIVAAIEPADGAAPGPDLAAALSAHCRANLAKFKCPQDFLFRDELPRSGAGKLLRRAVRDELASNLGTGR